MATRNKFVKVNGVRVNKKKTAGEIYAQMQRIQRSNRFHPLGRADKVVTSIDNGVTYNHRTGNLVVGKNYENRLRGDRTKDPNLAGRREMSIDGIDISDAKFAATAGSKG